MILTVRGYSSKAAALVLLLFLASPSLAWQEVEVAVDRVIDGDTFVTKDGSRVRLLNVDAPEDGAPMASEAASWLSGRLGEVVRMTVCSEQDRYGRRLAFVKDGDSTLNLELLETGLAMPLLLAPCGERLAAQSLEAAARALAERKGLYSPERMTIVAAESAGELLGAEGAVTGRVLSAGSGPRALFLNFGTDYATDFTAVLFNDAVARFASVGLDPRAWVGWKVAVMGKVTEYNGPQVVVRYPEQIVPLQAPDRGSGAGEEVP